MGKIYSGGDGIQHLVIVMAAWSAVAPSPQSTASVQQGHPSCGMVSSVGLATQPPLVPASPGFLAFPLIL